MLKALYILIIGLLFAFVVGLGFSAFYPAPQYPAYPVKLESINPEKELTAEDKAARQQYDNESKTFMDVNERYNVNLSIGLIVVALITIAVSILGLGKIEIIGDGVTLGGVFTLLYGLGRAVAGGDEKIRFVAALVGLVVIIGLIYWKYIRPKKEALPQ